MIYITNIKKIDNELLYTIYETNTESVMDVSADYIRKLIRKYNMEIINCKLHKNVLMTKEWTNRVNMMISGDNNEVLILLSRINNNKFKLINNEGSKVYAKEDTIKEYIRKGSIINRSKSTDRDYKFIDTYEIIEDEEFRKNIDTKYKQFIAKSMLLGLDIQFEYIIENNEVKITDYIGSSKNVIIPGWITALAAKSFRNKKIEKLTLNNGLKYIGRHAFSGNRIPEVIIPESVELIYAATFSPSLTKWSMFINPADIHNKQTGITILNKSIRVL